MALGQGDRVVIVGCGPVGMVLTLAFHRRGIPVTLIERNEGPIDDQRAAAIQPSSLEMLSELGVSNEIHQKGLISPTFHYRDRVSGELVAEFDFSQIADLTEFPHVVQYEQFKLVKTIMNDIGETPDVKYRFSSKVVGLEQQANNVVVSILNQDNETEKITTPWLVGCDGFSSAVREAACIEFKGFTYPERFVKIGTDFDFEAAGQALCIRNFFSDPDEWCNLFKVNGYGPPGIWRTVFPTGVGETDEECLSQKGIQNRLQKFFPKNGDYNIIYAGLYHVHQRVVETFRKGRVLVAGDAAHVNNPIGGLGMNGGIHDAVSLAEKLSRVIDGDNEGYLDLYSRQRHKAQMDGVQAMSIANKKLMEAKDPTIREQQLREVRATAEDPDRSRAYCLNAALFTSLEKAAAVE
ncbi:MAG: Para-nitrophenol 4-monooxygenase [Alphaproteobacteria bacterium MarineAlpha11_Bin1]|nr:MAG: Para-nitrophenol 4-monooxygenase [Alphaproteobacteria bacterium MarineAlpha11_Bin1]|tara:strand:- start:13441 stop:14664 length:1224 start_codon:yes stop_codon:yes gene_type:complete